MSESCLLSMVLGVLLINLDSEHRGRVQRLDNFQNVAEYV